VYQRALRIKAGIPHPRTLAVMQECGGKMYMQEKDYDMAIQAFFQVGRWASECSTRSFVIHHERLFTLGCTALLCGTMSLGMHH
jgi:hypothetical protein